jgi:cell division protein FtsZ
MNTVREFAAEDAHIIFGAVYDENMGEEIRVTVVATGLGQAQAKRQPLTVIDTPVMHQATGTDGGFMQNSATGIDYSQLDTPAIVRKGRSATVEALANSGVDRYDIPAFLRKQAD